MAPWNGPNNDESQNKGEEKWEGIDTQPTYVRVVPSNVSAVVAPIVVYVLSSHRVAHTRRDRRLAAAWRRTFSVPRYSRLVDLLSYG